MVRGVRVATAEPAEAASPAPQRPVAIAITLETAVAKPSQLLAGVKRIKGTGWYRALRKRGLQFVPLGYQEGVILAVVGTSASLGLAYVAYKRLKRTVPELPDH